GIFRVRLDAQSIERFAEEASRGRCEYNVEDFAVSESEFAQPVDIGLGDRGGVVRDLVSELHDRKIGRLEVGCAVVIHQASDRLWLEKPGHQDGSVSQGAVAGTETARRSQCRQLVATQI